MEKAKSILFHSWYVLKSLDARIYHIILDVAVFSSVITLAAGAVLRFPASSLWSAGGILLYLIVLQFITMRYPRFADACRVMLVLGINLVLFPAALFTCGGIYSGIILFCLCGLFLCAILIHGRAGFVVFALSLAVMSASLILSVRYPQFVQPMTERQHLGHMVLSLILTAIALFSVAVLIIHSYYVERAQNEALLEKLRDLSVIDALTGLYNRRELFRRLEILYNPAEPDLLGRYILMFDVDDFKRINDTYGHSFGDAVLASVSGVLRESVHAENEELFSRYGGEEFVGVITVDSMDAAFARGDDIRRRISELRWNDLPEVRISISGGVIACAEHPNLTQAMHDVDCLLYRAKAAGKNRLAGAAEAACP